MKKIIYLKGFLSLLFAIIANLLFSQTITFTSPVSGSTTNVTNGSNLSITAERTTASWNGGNSNWTFNFNVVSGPVGGVSLSPDPISGNNIEEATTTATFSIIGTYVISCTVNENGGGETHTTSTGNNITINVVAPVPLTPIGCNGQFYVSYGPTSGANGNTLLNKLTFAGSNLSASSFPVNPGSMGFNSMGLNPIDGYIYAVRYPAGGGKSRLIRIGNGLPNQVDLGEIAALNTGEISYSGCFDENGDYYFTTNSGTGSGRLMRITNANLAARTATQIAASGFTSIYDIAINPVNGQMYATNSSTGANFLATVNKATGAITTIAGGNAGGNFFAGLFFDEVGELYGYRANGSFFQINKTTAALSAAGSGAAYSGADGCSCSFGRVFHDLDFTLNPSNQICPSQMNPTFPFPLTVSVTNESSSQQTGLTYTLDISDPAKRLVFTESSATIKANFITAGLATVASTVTLSSATPGDPINKLVITGFQTGGADATLSAVLQVAVATLGGTYLPVPIQSEITGLDPVFGGNDLSNDPTSIPPDDATVITFCPNITLPVTLLSFGGNLNNNTAQLDWSAENQINFSFYSIERSINGVDFKNVGTQAGLGTNTSREQYQFTEDLSAEHSNIFLYRLKMVDVDGTFKYSNVIVLKRDEGATPGIRINPNPLVRGGQVSVVFNSPKKNTVDFKVIDMSGRIVATQRSNVAEGANSVAITSLDKLQPGTYVLQMNDGIAIQTAKFVVAK